MHDLFNLDIPAYLHGPTLLAALAGFGLIVGILTGLFGVGGGFIITPLLKVVFGIPYELAIGSSLSFIIGAGSSAMRRHMRLGNVEFRSTVILAAGSMAGAIGGAQLNELIHRGLGEVNYTMIINGSFVVILVLTAWMVARPQAGASGAKSLLQRMAIGPRIDLPAAGLSAVSLPGICLVGLVIGFTSGMLGIGGGVLFVPLLIVAVGLTPHQAVGTSLGVVVFGSIAGTVRYATAGHVNMWIVMPLLASSVVGVQIGASLCRRLHPDRLRRYFAVLVLAIALVLAGELAWSFFADGLP